MLNEGFLKKAFKIFGLEKCLQIFNLINIV